MRKENVVLANVGELNARLTRARAAALHASRQLAPLNAPNQPDQLAPLNAPNQPDQKRVLRANTKRIASDENSTNGPDIAGLQCKKRAVLQDVTNVSCNSSNRKCFNATKIQTKSSKQARQGWANSSKVAPAVAPQIHPTQAILQKEGNRETAKIEAKLEEVRCSVNVKGDATLSLNRIKDDSIRCHWLTNQSSRMPSPQSPPRNAEKISFSGTSITSSDPDFKDIDSDKKDPQLCSLYAQEIYKNFRVAEKHVTHLALPNLVISLRDCNYLRPVRSHAQSTERERAGILARNPKTGVFCEINRLTFDGKLLRRPSPNFMETIQRDITQSMRGILVDWLVEVSEEYKLVPDTLYLTVYLIDWFLSQNYIERQRLQLLGITCMLIASKYEEIFAPRVEEFCFITDNTYTREEVLKMESQVLKYFGFQLFAPTAKTFLRRFLRAAQASYTSPSIELEYLANYLAELTLVDYCFLNFAPSIIAASAVFLARWTLDQSSHPWNPTLEHYTTYNASDIKTTVVALQDLQLNTNGCPLNAIRMKYRQQRFKSVATLSSPKLLETLF